jgi:hypothetical protein
MLWCVDIMVWCGVALMLWYAHTVRYWCATGVVSGVVRHCTTGMDSRDNLRICDSCEQRGILQYGIGVGQCGIKVEKHHVDSTFQEAAQIVEVNTLVVASRKTPPAKQVTLD